MILYILLAVLMLGILITVHEFGHFIAARACGIAVKEFSIGFGPKIYKHTCKSGMLFSLRPIPLGGFCMFYGDTDDDPDGTKQDDPRSMNKASAWKRMITVASGPLMNFLLALLAAFILMLCVGKENVTVLNPVISMVNENSPAQEAGLMPQDVVLSANGTDLSGMGASAFVSSGLLDTGDPVEIIVDRGGEQVSLTLTPQWSEENNRYMVGIAVSTLYDYTPMTAAHAVPAAWNLCKTAAVNVVDALRKLVTTGEGIQDTSGPIGLVKTVAEYTRAYGFDVYAELMVLISVNLGLMNLLPIPGLDGSRLIFLLIELIRGKPVKQKVEAIIHLCGYAVLILLALALAGKDIFSLFQ